MSDNNMGLREKVKKGIVSLDEAIEIAKDYNENIQRWLKRRKDAGVVASSDDKPKKNKRKRKAKKNAKV
jgi:hypothetical protein